MTNPFENEENSYYVLVNNEGQHSLWPSHIKIPEGWNNILGPNIKSTCLDFIADNWTDMRPTSLINKMVRIVN